jgi:heat-inducible transcriptional repressor
MASKAEDIQQREQAILDEIVRYYMDTQEAISARTLSKISRLALSPTTIRNLMEDLSADGLLTTEGATRGRVPTQKAFVVYVNRLGERPVPPAARAPEIPAMEEGRPARLRAVVNQLGRMLAQETGCAALAALPERDRYPLDWVKFAALPKSEVLVSVGTLFGDVWSKVLMAAEPFPEALLQEVGRFINDTYRGRAIERIRRDVMAGEPKGLLEEMPSLGAAFRMLRRAFEWEDEPDRPAWGMEHFYGIPECNDPQQLLLLHHALADPDFLGRTLQRGRAIQGGWIAIGTETGQPGLENCALVALPFGFREWEGRLAVLGPMRMDYSRVFSLAARCAERISGYLREMSESAGYQPSAAG